MFIVTFLNLNYKFNIAVSGTQHGTQQGTQHGTQQKSRITNIFDK